jgi:hypothetical protein
VRVIYLMLGVVLVLGWLGFEVRRSHPEWARVLFTVAAFLLLLLVGAFFGLYGSG